MYFPNWGLRKSLQIRKQPMGAVASIVHALSCQACDASLRSQCCDQEDACNCDIETHEVAIEPETQDLHISCPWLAINASA